jgi:GT2 family glycosyltransferase
MVNKELDFFTIKRLISDSGIFDREWYRTLYPDVATVGPLWHYVRHGGIQGRKPHPLFEGGWYLSQNPDVARSRVNPLVHYLMWGSADGRDPNPFFDSDWYLQQYSDVAAANLNPLSHYILLGASEGRNPSPHFDACAYALEQLDGNPAATNPLSHFIQYGWGRAKRRAIGGLGQSGHRQIPATTFTNDDIKTPDILDRRLSIHAPRMTAESEEFISTGKAAWDAYGTSRLQQLIASTERLRCPQVHSPELSIVVVLFNRAHLTLMCLESILRNADVTYELIVIDNNSIDNTPHLLDHLDGVRILRNEANIGFGAACMQAARLARGEYICFLNNDALLLPGSLGAAIQNFHRDPTVGAVGGKILFSDGRLQEAGCILWSDGTAWGLGRNDDPGLPEFNFRRPVDYCSGVFLVTRRELFQKIGGFDSIYHPAYYEDTDYCVSLWSSGYTVVYEPMSVVAHYESASSEDLSKAKTLIAKNQRVFAAKWRDFLRGQYFRLSENVPSARISVRARGKRILYMAGCAVSSKMSGRETRALKILSGLVVLGHQVTCLTDEKCDDLSSSLPSKVEIRDRNQVDQRMIEHSRHFDVLWCARPEEVRRLIECGVHWSESRPRIVYEILGEDDGGDMEHEVADGLETPVDPLLADAADVVLVSSHAQADTLRRTGVSNVVVLSTGIKVFADAVSADQDRFCERLADIVG